MNEAARLGEVVRAAAARLGLARVGAIAVEPPRRFDLYRSWLAAGHHGEMAYLAAPEHLAARADLGELLRGARTVVVQTLPGEERLRFERGVLFPLAGLDPSEADRYHRVEREIRRLAPLRVEAARAYLDGERDRVQSVLFLENEALVPAPWAFLRFVDRYRTYVIAYTLGPKRVRRRIEKSTDPWREYAALATEAKDET